MVTQLDRIEAKLERILSQPEAPIVGVPEGMVLTGTGSKTGFRNFVNRYNVVAYSRGKYRRTDLTNAIATQVIERAAKRRLLDQQAEEALLPKPTGNFHD